MTTAASMLRAVRRYNALRDPARPRHFTLNIAAGDEFPEWIIDLQGPQDDVVVREYPRGYLGREDVDFQDITWGWMTNSSGRTAILYRDGRIAWRKSKS